MTFTSLKKQLSIWCSKRYNVLETSIFPINLMCEICEAAAAQQVLTTWVASVICVTGVCLCCDNLISLDQEQSGQFKT
jgi:hypothetical protein